MIERAIIEDPRYTILLKKSSCPILRLDKYKDNIHVKADMDNKRKNLFVILFGAFLYIEIPSTKNTTDIDNKKMS